jgi:hypothetical protein
MKLGHPPGNAGDARVPGRSRQTEALGNPVARRYRSGRLRARVRDHGTYRAAEGTSGGLSFHTQEDLQLPGINLSETRAEPGSLTVVTYGAHGREVTCAPRTSIR